MDITERLNEINKFRQQNGIPYNYGNIRFDALVEYECPLYKKAGTSKISISMGPPKEGRTQLLSEIFNDAPHIEFEPKFQDFKFDPITNKLIIDGYSHKIGTKYKVSIRK